MNQISRIIKILELLSMGKVLSSSSLFELFGRTVSLRTIQRDFLSIEAAGIPLNVKRTEGNEQLWSFPGSYRKMILPTVQKNELLSLHVLKAYLKGFKGTIIWDNLEKVIKKLESIAPGDVYFDFADYKTDDALFWNQDYGSLEYGEFDSIINSLIEAIGEKKWVCMTYRSITDDKTRTYTVFPQMIFVFQMTLYVVVYFPKHNESLALAVHRIIGLEAGSEQSDFVPVLDVSEFRKKRFGVFYGEPERVELLVKENFVKWFEKRQWHPSQKIRSEGKDLVIELEVPVTPDFLTWLIGWSEGVIVLSPESLKNKLIDKLRGVLSNYE